MSHPKWDGKNLVVTGGSQGGALTITTAGLDPRVTALAPYYPALSDMAGYLKGRAGGWPHLFKDEKDGHRTPAKIRTAAYYDVVNFARRVKAPGLYSWGWNDEVCPPTSMHAAYNVVTAPKELLLAAETGHNTVPEETAKVDRWIDAPTVGALTSESAPTAPATGSAYLTQNPVWYNYQVMPPAEPVPRLAEFEAECRRRGLAVTVQRRTVFEELAGRRDHPTADQVYDAVRGRLPGPVPHDRLPRPGDAGGRRPRPQGAPRRRASPASTR